MWCHLNEDAYSIFLKKNCFDLLAVGLLQKIITILVTFLNKQHGWGLGGKIGLRYINFGTDTNNSKKSHG